MEGVTADYIHAGGKIAVLVGFDADSAIAAKDEFKEYAHNVGMQIAAMNPQFLDRNSVPKDVVEHEKKIASEQAAASGKPANVIEKMVVGKVNKTLKEICLVDQAYVKDSSLSVQKYTEQVAKELGGKITIKGFVRYEKGEGLEKRNENFAEEIKNLVK
jgi:elongation factor Ts